ncbi:MAG: hypothetical protein HY075_04060 [Deltaproteobacteria bacterium]|nr:hypothetical protein [Deltaproteobacteria bacterium]
MTGLRRLFSVLFFAATATAVAAPPTKLDPDRCRKLLPPEKAAQEGYRDYYRGFVDDICEKGPASSDSVWQSCVISAMQSGRFKAGDISEAYNDCNPRIRSCLADFRARAGSHAKALGTFIKRHCESIAEYSDTEKKCTIDLLVQRPGLLTTPETVYGVCVDPAQPCVRDFLRRGKYAKSDDLLHGIAQVCRRPEQDIPADYRDCMREEFEAGRFLANANNAFYVCDPKRRGLRECMRKELAEPLFKKRLGNRLFREQAESAEAFCEVSNAAARACVLERMGDGLELADAKAICRYSNADMRECLVDVILRRGQLVDRSALPDSDLLEFGKRICAVSNLKTRRCALDDFKARHKGSASPVARIALSIAPCLATAAERVSCMSKLSPGVGAKLGWSDAKYVSYVAGQICDIPTFEIRDCVLAGLGDYLRGYATISALAAT